MKQLLKTIGTQIAHNPKTSVAGAVVICSALLPKYAALFATLATGVGLLLSKDGDTGASKDTPRADKVIAQVEALKLPTPPTEIVKP